MSRVRALMGLAAVLAAGCLPPQQGPAAEDPDPEPGRRLPIIASAPIGDFGWSPRSPYSIVIREVTKVHAPNKDAGSGRPDENERVVRQTSRRLGVDTIDFTRQMLILADVGENDGQDMEVVRVIAVDGKVIVRWRWVPAKRRLPSRRGLVLLVGRAEGRLVLVPDPDPEA